MKTIAIDARFYGAESRGLGRYTKMLIRGLEDIDQAHQYHIYLRRQNFDEYFPRRANFIKKLADVNWYSLKEQILLPFYFNRREIDLIHYPHFNLPLACPKPFVVTIHDLILLEYPTKKATTLDPVRYALKSLAYKAVLRKAIFNSEKIITVSQFSRRDIVRHFPSAKAKIEVIYDACEPAADRVKLNAEQKERIQQCKIPKEYVLYVGGAYPHKNLENLVAAYGEAKKSPAFKDVALVLTGGDDYFYRRIKELGKRCRIADIYYPGLVDDEMLMELYANARLFIFPSVYEGFGLPPLEAMSWGVPVLASSAGSLPEVLGDAAYYFNPYNVSEMAAALVIVCSDEKKRVELTAKGKKRVAIFSWQKTAGETLEVYKNILEANGHSPK